MFDVHRSDAEMVLLLLQLVVQNFLEANAFKVEKGNQAFVLASVSHNMVSVESKAVNM